MTVKLAISNPSSYDGVVIVRTGYQIESSRGIDEQTNLGSEILLSIR